MSHKYQDIADKYNGAECIVYTMNGNRPAIISHSKEPFALVRTLDGSISMPVNWPTVKYRMEDCDKIFYSC